MARRRVGTGLPDWGSAVARTELDDHLRTTAIKAGATAVDGPAPSTYVATATASRAVVFKTDDGTVEIACRRLVVADGVRSPLGKVLGREWHRDTVYGVAGRSYVASGMSDDPWISSHLELRGRGRQGPVRLRLDLPARHRRGEPRRRHPGDRQAARRTSRSSR